MDKENVINTHIQILKTEISFGLMKEGNSIFNMDERGGHYVK
jgi:hypothetical protein